jgi:hypothetical protein
MSVLILLLFLLAACGAPAAPGTPPQAPTTAPNLTATPAGAPEPPLPPTTTALERETPAATSEPLVLPTFTVPPTAGPLITPTVAVPLPVEAATLVMEPTTVAPGTHIKVEGHNFPPGATIYFTYGPNLEVGSGPIGADPVIVGSGGMFRTEVVFPEVAPYGGPWRREDAGEYVLIAGDGSGESPVTAKAYFTLELEDE